MDRTTRKTALTLKQQRFVDAYLGDAHGNATLAAREAGYQGNDVTLQATGSDLVYHPLVSSEIERQKAALRRKTGVTREWLTERTQQLINDAAADGAHGPVTKGLELLAKLHGLLETKGKLDISVAHRVEALDGLDVEELRVIVAAYRESQKMLPAPAQGDG
ncbi:hypothetical protein CMI37_20410 [Candidatus Pacearchaeota archaeon]|jgi:phage terminase small subunit|nr:hypothetical protein [Candidatus Pacearchaeota archaeon]|tara:strand:- start:1179 stop:1664 length:486 start_codon:yes stop_codon:yes gene_type:complete